MFPGASGGFASTQPNVVTTPVAVTNTVTETTLYTFAVPPGTLGTTNRLRLTLWGNVVAGVGPPTLTFRAKYGSAVVVVANALVTLLSQTGQWCLTVDLMGTGGTATQLIAAELQGHITTAIATVAEEAFRVWATAAIDSTAAQNLVVTVQAGSAVATTTVNMQGASLELIK